MELTLLALGVGGTAAVVGGAFALGLRHGIDWDHIAAITDITSTAAGTSEPDESWLTNEPGVLLTDERDHATAEMVRRRPIAGGTSSVLSWPANVGAALTSQQPRAVAQRRAMFLGTLYAIGHGTVVTVLGLLAIFGAELLPTWVDGVMERVVGLTLVLLAAYLFYSLYRYFRGDGDFHLRSRWMLLFAGARNIGNWVWGRLRGRSEHVHVHGVEQYGARTAYSIGLIHGVGAETGTQVLIIATAVGAGTTSMGIVALFSFVGGLLLSNSFVTVATSAGFVSARRRQLVYVFAGLIAAVFSLVVGVVFLAQSGGLLPDLGQYFEWLGGPNA